MKFNLTQLAEQGIVIEYNEEESILSLEPIDGTPITPAELTAALQQALIVSH